VQLGSLACVCCVLKDVGGGGGGTGRVDRGCRRVGARLGSVAAVRHAGTKKCSIRSVFWALLGAMYGRWYLQSNAHIDGDTCSVPANVPYMDQDPGSWIYMLCILPGLIQHSVCRHHKASAAHAANPSLTTGHCRTRELMKAKKERMKRERKAWQHHTWQ
jgi:hypothetical protein